MVAKTMQGLEDILVEELEILQAKNIKKVRRAVIFEGDLKLLYKANLWLRTCLKILVPIKEFEADSPEAIYQVLRMVEWDNYMSVDQTFAVQSTVNSKDFTHSKFVSYRVKDAIVDYFKKKYDKRPSVSVANPSIYININVSDRSCTLSLDSSGESLHKRGWRVEQTEAPINEVLAAGLLLHAGWNGKSNLYDFMCGSGTLLIEGALIALNIPPGIYRESFGFMGWPNYNESIYTELYNDDSAEKEFDFKIYGSDISKIAIEKTNRNIKNAGLSKYVETECTSFQNITPMPEGGLIIMNPPYGERLKGQHVNILYKIVGERFKHDFTGFEAWIISNEKDYFNDIALRPKKKIALKNGAIDCEFRGYELYEGSKKESKRKLQIAPKNTKVLTPKHSDKLMVPQRPRKNSKTIIQKKFND